MHFLSILAQCFNFFLIKKQKLLKKKICAYFILDKLFFLIL